MAERHDIFDILTSAIRDVEIHRNERVGDHKYDARVLEAAVRDVLDMLSDIHLEYMLPEDSVAVTNDFISDD